MLSTIPPSAHDADTLPMIPIEPTSMLAKLVDEMREHAVSLPPSLHSLLPASEACLDQHWGQYVPSTEDAAPSDGVAAEAFGLITRRGLS